jgi:hypothetical protein
MSLRLTIFHFFLKNMHNNILTVKQLELQPYISKFKRSFSEVVDYLVKPASDGDIKSFLIDEATNLFS